MFHFLARGRRARISMARPNGPGYVHLNICLSLFVYIGCYSETFKLGFVFGLFPFVFFNSLFFYFWYFALVR